MTVQSGFAAVMARRYALWGRNVTFNNPVTHQNVTLRMIDATTGVEVGDNALTVATVEPAALVRKADLTTVSLTPANMVGVSFTLNGASWRVQSTQPKPAIHGAESGEVVLLLSKAS